MVVGDEDDISAAAAVTAGGAAVGDELFASPADQAVPAVAGADEDAHLVDEAHGLLCGRRDVGCLGGDRVDRHEGLALVAALVEADRAVAQGEQRVVLAGADVDAGVEAAADLAHEDVARAHDLAAELLDATSLGLGVAAV